MAVPVGVQQVYLYQNCPANSFPGLGQTGGMFPGCTPTTSVASLDSSGKPGDKDSINPSLDLIGLRVAFESLADNIVGNMPGNGFHQVYLRSLCLNLPIPATAGGAPPCGANATIAVSVDVQGNLARGGDSITLITPSAARRISFPAELPARGFSCVPRAARAFCNCRVVRRKQTSSLWPVPAPLRGLLQTRILRFPSAIV